MSTINQKPNVRAVWASAGSLGAVDVDRIQEGWVEEIPPSEVANWIENRQDTAIKYLFQEGFAEWDSAFEYRLNSLVKYDGKVYIATLANSGRQPDTENSFWSVAFDDKGSAAAVQAIVDSILNTEGFLNLYVSKATPVMNSTAKAPAFRADSGSPSNTVGSDKVGFAFIGDDTTGLFKVGNSPNQRLALVNGGVVGGIVPLGNEGIGTSDETLVTAAFLKKYIDERLESSRIQIGMSIITQNHNDPASYLGYGVWQRDCEGMAIVGASTSVTGATPDWVKTVNNTYGEYVHSLTNGELPTLTGAIQHIANTTPVGVFTGVGAARASIEGEPSTFSHYDTTFSIGGDLPHNNVQPSKTKFIFTRVA